MSKPTQGDPKPTDAPRKKAEKAEPGQSPEGAEVDPSEADTVVLDLAELDAGELEQVSGGVQSSDASALSPSGSSSSILGRTIKQVGDPH